MSDKIFKNFLLCILRKNIYFPRLIKEMILNEMKFQNLLSLVEKIGSNEKEKQWESLSKNKNVTFDMIQRTIDDRNTFRWDYNTITDNENFKLRDLLYIKNILNSRNLYIFNISRIFCRPDITFDDMLSISYDNRYKISGQILFNSDIKHKQAEYFFYKNIKVPPYFNDDGFYVSELEDFSLEFVRTEIFEKKRFSMKNYDWRKLFWEISFRDIINMDKLYPDFFSYLEPKIKWSILSCSKKNTLEDIIDILNDKRFSDKIEWVHISRYANITLNDVVRSQNDPELCKKCKWDWYWLECVTHMSFDEFEQIYKENPNIIENKIEKRIVYTHMTGINSTNIDRLIEIMRSLKHEFFLTDIIDNDNITFDILLRCLQIINDNKVYSRKIQRWFSISRNKNITFEDIKKSLQDPNLSSICKWDLSGLSTRGDLTIDNLYELYLIFNNPDDKEKIAQYIASKNQIDRLTYLETYEF